MLKGIAERAAQLVALLRPDGPVQYGPLPPSSAPPPSGGDPASRAVDIDLSTRALSGGRGLRDGRLAAGAETPGGGLTLARLNGAVREALGALETDLSGFGRALGFPAEWSQRTSSALVEAAHALTTGADFQASLARMAASQSLVVSDDGYAYRGAMVLEQATLDIDFDTGTLTASVHRVSLVVEATAAAFTKRSDPLWLGLDGNLTDPAALRQGVVFDIGTLAPHERASLLVGSDALSLLDPTIRPPRVAAFESLAQRLGAESDRLRALFALDGRDLVDLASSRPHRSVTFDGLVPLGSALGRGVSV